MRLLMLPVIILLLVVELLVYGVSCVLAFLHHAVTLVHIRLYLTLACLMNSDDEVKTDDERADHDVAREEPLDI